MRSVIGGGLGVFILAVWRTRPASPRLPAPTPTAPRWPPPLPSPRPPAPTPTAPADLLHRAQCSPQHPPPRRPVPPHQTPPPRPPAPSPWGTPTTPPIAPSAAPSTHPHGTPLTPAQHPLHSPQHPAPTAPHTTPSTMSSAAPKASFKIPAQKKFRGADKKMEPGFSGSGAPERTAHPLAGLGALIAIKMVPRHTYLCLTFRSVSDIPIRPSFCVS